jgi:hypothetical protein
VQEGAQKSLSGLIAGPSSALLDSCPSDLWQRLNRLLSSSLAKASQVCFPILAWLLGQESQCS